MASQMTLPTLLGVIIGAVAFLFCLAAAIVVLFLRIKHRKLLAQTNAVGERRFSRYHGGHMSITDDDVARMPGTGAAMRESLNNNCSRFSAYAPMALREHIEQQSHVGKSMPALTAALRSTSNMQLNKETSPPTGSLPIPWPKPSRLTRANRPPVMTLQPSAIPIAEAIRSGEAPLSEQKRRSVQKLIPRWEFGNNQNPASTYDSRGCPGASPDLITFPSPDLKPRPLFHEKPRSISYGMISDLTDNEVPRGTLRVLQSQQLRGKRGNQRPVSLTSGGPGTAPKWVAPSPPAEAIAIRQQASLKASGFKHNLEGGVGKDMPLLRGSSTMSPQSETRSTLIKLIPPSPSETLKQKSEPVSENPTDLSTNNINAPPVDSTDALKRTLKAPLNSHKSVGTSMRNSIARSNSSGLSESLLNHGWSRPVSDSSLMKHTANDLARFGAPFDDGRGPHISIFDFGLPSNPDHNDAIQSQPELDGVRSKHQSPSILQVIAGNEQSPRKHSHRARPSSIATENPCRLKTDVLAKETATKEETADVSTEERKIFSSSPIKRPAVSTQVLPEPAVMSKDENVPNSRSPHQARSLRQPRVDPPAFCPPSSMSSLDPQSTPIRRGKGVATPSSSTSSYLKTLAKLTGSEDSDSSPSSIISTPTRKPDEKRGLPGTNPNRQRTIFDSPDNTTQWLTLQPPALSLGFRGTNESPQRPSARRLNDQSASRTANIVMDGDDSQPVPLLYRFPSPPSPTRVSRSRQPPPKSQSQPLLHISRRTPVSSGSYSPRSQRPPVATSDVAEQANGSPSDEVRQSIIELRRMNSEISRASKAGREHKRYLSLGDNESAILEDSDRDAGREKGKQKGRPNGPRTLSVATTGQKALVGKEFKKGGNEMSRATEQTGPVKERVNGPRAMPGWVNENAVVTSGGEVEVTAGGVGVERSNGSWYDADGFLKQV